MRIKEAAGWLRAGGFDAEAQLLVAMPEVVDLLRDVLESAQVLGILTAARDDQLDLLREVESAIVIERNEER